MVRAPSRLENKALSREPQGGFVRRSISVRIAALLLVVSMAAPAIAAPRDESPVDRFERVMSRIISRIHHVFDLADATQPPR